MPTWEPDTTLMIEWEGVEIVESHATLSSCHLMIARSFMHVNDEWRKSHEVIVCGV